MSQIKIRTILRSEVVSFRLSYILGETGLIFNPMLLRKIKYRFIAPTLVRITPSVESRYHLTIFVHQCRLQRCVARTHYSLTQIVEAVSQVIFSRIMLVLASIAAESVFEYNLSAAFSKRREADGGYNKGALKGDEGVPYQTVDLVEHRDGIYLFISF